MRYSHEPGYEDSITDLTEKMLHRFILTTVKEYAIYWPLEKMTASKVRIALAECCVREPQDRVEAALSALVASGKLVRIGGVYATA